MKLQVLVVDDNGPWLKYLTIALERDGYEVTCALGGIEAMTILEKCDFDAVLSDMVMPGRNGLEVLRAARVRMPQARLVLMSAYPLAEDQQKLATDLKVDFLAKPFGPDDLKPILETVPARPSSTVLRVAAAGRRRVDRVPLKDAALRAFLADRIVVSDLNIARSIVDLCEHGLGFLADQPLRAGTRLRISLRLTPKSLIEGDAVVRWSTPQGKDHRVGAEFLSVSKERAAAVASLRKSAPADGTKRRVV